MSDYVIEVGETGGEFDVMSVLNRFALLFSQRKVYNSRP
jgi:hypothetical protein